MGRIVTALIEFDGRGFSTGNAIINGRPYTNFPSGVIQAQVIDGKSTTKTFIAYQAEIADNGSPATLSAYTMHDHRMGKQTSVSGHA